MGRNSARIAGRSLLSRGLSVAVGTRAQLAANIPVDDRSADICARPVCSAVAESAPGSEGQSKTRGAADMKQLVLTVALLGIGCTAASASSWPLWDHYAARFISR